MTFSNMGSRYEVPRAVKPGHARARVQGHLHMAGILRQVPVGLSLQVLGEMLRPGPGAMS